MPTTDQPANAWVQPAIDLGPLTASAAAESASGYGQSEVRTFTGVTYRQLDHWTREGLIIPSVCHGTGSGSRRRYSFRDILAVRVLKRLTDAGVSLRNVSRAVQTLQALGESELTSVVLVSDGVTVYQCRSDDEVIDLVRGGQGVFVVALDAAVGDLRTALAATATVTDLATRRPANSAARSRQSGRRTVPA